MAEKDTRPLVLIVDDDEQVRGVARRFLEAWGYRVAEAADGPQGIDVAMTQHPHLILLDVRMKGMSGFEVLPRLRADPSLALTPVVMLTGLASTEDHTNGIRLGADDYLTKPLDVVLFQARMNSLLKRETYRREADQLRRNFTAMIVHDIRNPLNVVRAFAELLLTEEPPINPEFLKTSLQRIINSSDRALELASQMLDLSQLESGRVTLCRRRENLTQLLKSIAEDQCLLAKRKHLTFDVKLDPGLEAEIDQRKLSEAIVNLVANAIKFTPEGGHITLEASEVPPGEIRVSVKDTGPGIPTDQLGTIFAPWRQVKGAPVTSAKGYGLGLAISKMVVEAHGGNISVQSEPGAGTTFVIQIPIQTPAALRA